jgi:hypothetical protein
MSDVKETKKVIAMIKLLGPWAAVFLSGLISGYFLSNLLGFIS